MKYDYLVYCFPALTSKKNNLKNALFMWNCEIIRLTKGLFFRNRIKEGDFCHENKSKDHQKRCTGTLGTIS